MALNTTTDICADPNDLPNDPREMSSTNNAGKDNRKEFHQQYYIKNKEKIKAKSKAYRTKHREKVNEWFREYYKKNKQHVLCQRKKKLIEKFQQEIMKQFPSLHSVDAQLIETIKQQLLKEIEPKLVEMIETQLLRRQILKLWQEQTKMAKLF